MAVTVRMPDFGTAVDEIRIVQWLIQEGEAVARGQMLAVIETDKASSELESVGEGVLLRQAVPAGESVKAGTVIAYIGRTGEALPEEKQESPSAVVAPVPAAVRSPAGRRVAPVVANLARQLGVDLAGIEGTGESGTITRDDVIRASRSQLSRGQAAAMRSVVKSTVEIPHYRLAASIDMSSAGQIHADQDVSYDAIFLKAMAKAAEAVPLVKAHLEGERIVRPETVDIAVAVGSGNDLYLAVVRNVPGKDLQTVDREVKELAVRARQGSLQIGETSGGCMTLTNLGMYPIDWFEAIIFPGQSTILALGAVQPRPVVMEGKVEIRPIVTVNLAADHRLINGRTAAEFVGKLKEIIESGVIA